jgi:hypothetical protein
MLHGHGVSALALKETRPRTRGTSELPATPLTPPGARSSGGCLRPSHFIHSHFSSRFFEAEEDAQNAPLMCVYYVCPLFRLTMPSAHRLTFGGGPGTTGMLRPLGSQGPCILTANGTAPNPHRITQRFNMLALDHVRRCALSSFVL